MADIAQHADAALANLSNALDDLQYSPDQRPVPLINSAMADLRSILRATPQAEAQTLQQLVRPWLLECFGPEISGDLVERGDRFLEEVLELLQAHGYDRSRIPALIDYVYSRPAGEPSQEAGGVMVTLAAYCGAADVDMHVAGDVELARVWTKIEKIREKQASKAGIHSPLPGSNTAAIEHLASPRSAELFAVEMLDFQPLTEHNSGTRLWQVLEAGGIPDGMQVPALLGALRHALGARA